MNAEDRWLSETLNKIVESQGRMEGKLDAKPCPLHAAEIASMRADFAKYREQNAVPSAVMRFLGTPAGKWLLGAILVLLGLSGAIQVYDRLSGASPVATAKASEVLPPSAGSVQPTDTVSE